MYTVYLRCKYSNKYFKNLKIKLKQTKISEKKTMRTADKGFD